MGRSRYYMTEPNKPHFITSTVLEWLPVFTRPDTTNIILGSWQYLRANDDFKLYSYVILDNHLHLIAQSSHLDNCIKRFRSYTARCIIDYLQQHNVRLLLERLAFAKKAHKKDRDYQFWQEGTHPEMIINEEMMREKIAYIHNNPVKRGYVDLPEHWRYSSARNYMGQEGLIEIDYWIM